MGDKRIEKNLIEGVKESKYAIVIISNYTANSKCELEEINILKNNYNNGKVTIFPILYEILPEDVPKQCKWLLQLIFKETNRHSGTREICNHIACKIMSDIKSKCCVQKIQEIEQKFNMSIPKLTSELLQRYYEIDHSNINSKVTMLYAIYLSLKLLMHKIDNAKLLLIIKIFERLFSETKLHIDIDYREIWLLEDSICILVHIFITIE